MIGDAFEFTKQLCEQQWTFADNLLEVAGDLTREREEQIRVLIEVARELDDGLLRRWSNFAAFYLAQICRLDTNPKRDLPLAVSPVPLPKRLAFRPHMFAKLVHIDYVRLDTHFFKFQ